MEIIKLYKGIYIVRNFFDKKHINNLLEYAKTITDEEWNNSKNPVAKYDIEKYWADKIFSPSQRELDPYQKLCQPPLLKMNWQVCQIFSNYRMNGLFRAIQRSSDIHKEGMAVHSDDGNEAHDDIKYGIVVYLNDDFVGGELFYPELDIEYKPIAGDMVVHKGSIPHGTRRVEVGNRYFLTAFIHGYDNTKFLLGDDDE